MKVAAMIPIKLNNERTPGKNTKCFSDGTPLIHFIERACIRAETIDEVYVYCSDDAIKEYLLPGVRYLKRPIYLDENRINCNDIIQEFITEVEADIYVVSHATGPFTRSRSIDACVNAVCTGKYDSAFLVKRIQEFLWKEGVPFNFCPANFPRTQDLEVIYSEAPGAYVFRKDTFMEYGRRVGKTPYLHEVDEIEGMDIDYPLDFDIADAVYMKIMREELQ